MTTKGDFHHSYGKSPKNQTPSLCPISQHITSPSPLYICQIIDGFQCAPRDIRHSKVHIATHNRWPITAPIANKKPVFTCSCSFLLLQLLLVTGLADVHAHLVVGRYRPLEVHAEPQVVVIRRELPEQTRPLFVCWHSHLHGEQQHCGFSGNKYTLTQRKSRAPSAITWEGGQLAGEGGPACQ